MGIAVLPWVVVQQEVAAERLVPLTVAGLTFNMVTQLAWHRDKWISPALAAFLAMTRTILGEQLDGETPEFEHEFSI